jgi:hypothetical protein
LTEANVLFSKKPTKPKKSKSTNGTDQPDPSASTALVTTNPHTNHITGQTNSAMNPINHVHNMSNSLNNTPVQNQMIKPASQFTSFQLLEPLKNSNPSSLSNSFSSSASLNNSTSNMKQKQSDETNSNKKLSRDLSNFDSSISTGSLDPFNDMELKTINDLEELKTILHNHQLEQQQKNASASFSNPNASLFSNMNITAPLNNSLLNNNNNNVNDKNNPLNKGSQNGGAGMSAGFDDNYGLPKISFVDFDIKSNKLN